MISIRDSKFIKSLHLKKFRVIENAFIVEGAKNVLELLLSDLEIRAFYATESFIAKYSSQIDTRQNLLQKVTESDLKKVGTFTNNNAAIAIVTIPTYAPIDISQSSILAFDRIKDPGNLGTVIRIADWYGFKDIVCSPESVDCYNAKVISATMGSFTRVKVHYSDLETLIKASPMVYGTTLQGTNMHDIPFESPAVILFGNESTGIEESLKKHINQEVKIMGYGVAESLNVAVSTAIFCDNYRRVAK